MSDVKEQFLLQRIRAFRDEQAFQVLYQEHAQGLIRYLTTKLPSYQEAQDAHSTAFMRTWNYILTNEVESFSGLLYTVARGVIADYYRTSARKPEEELSDFSHDDPQQLAMIVASSEVALVRKALGQLAENHRQILILKHFEQLSHREIARRMDKSEASIGVLVHRAHKHLRELLAHYDGPGTDTTSEPREGRS